MRAPRAFTKGVSRVVFGVFGAFAVFGVTGVQAKLTLTLMQKYSLKQSKKNTRSK